MLSIKQLNCYLLISLLSFRASAQTQQKINIKFDERKQYQTIENFAGSDAWSCQFVGNWPEEKTNKIADWLFSIDTLKNGDPKGIGLTMWRYNFGAGSAEQSDASGIKDEWRRAPSTLTTNKKVTAQNWFLQAAKKRGVREFLGFFNSPPVQLTKNGKAFADSGKCNIDSSKYKAFAEYTVKAVRQTEKLTGIKFDFISPINEPQWDWSEGDQEGCPYTNAEINGVVKTFNTTFQQNNLSAKLLITEAGVLKYLLEADDKQDKDNQVFEFFNPASANYVGNLSHVSPIIASHSYFTTSPFVEATKYRTNIKNHISAIKDLRFWQSEYCILGDNNGEINGDKKDTGITSALYVAKVLYEDLTFMNATAWQWWTALSAYDYKDGLVYVEKKEDDGKFSDSKMLWALGNYSRFIRPGMVRIEASMSDDKMHLSAFKDNKSNQVVCVLVNESAENKEISLADANKYKKKTCYTTSATESLAKHSIEKDGLIIPAKSIVTVVMQ